MSVFAQIAVGIATHIVLVIVAALVVVALVARVVDHVEAVDRRRFGGVPGRRVTLYRLLMSAVRYVVGFVALVIILDFVGVHTTSLLAGAGIVGLAVAFGAQNFIQDVVTGLSLMYEDEYQVGESVSFPALGLAGTVQEVGIRITRIAGSGGEVITLPNRLVSEVMNFSRGPVALSVPIPVGVSNDPAAVREALAAAAQQLSTSEVAVQVVGVTALVPGAATWTLGATVPNGQQGPLSLQLREAAMHECHVRGVALAVAAASGAG